MVQGVIRREVNSPGQNTIEMKVALWGKPTPAHLHVKALTNRGIRAWHGMIGYCMQD